MDRLKLLVVDDEPAVVEGISRLLSGLHPRLTISVASNATHALRTLREEGTDILITDIRMPVMDGLTLSQEAKNLSAPRIVVISGYKSFDYAQRAIQIGTVSYMLKPIRQEELKRLVKDLITDILEERRATLRSLLFGETKEIPLFLQQALRLYCVTVVQGAGNLEQDVRDKIPLILRFDGRDTEVREWVEDTSGNLIILADGSLTSFYGQLEHLASALHEHSPPGRYIGVSSEKRLAEDMRGAVKEAYAALEDNRDRPLFEVRFFAAAEASRRDSSWIIELKRWLLSNLPVADVNAAARHLGLSVPYVSFLFKKETGQNLSAYLAELRVTRAAWMIKNTTLKIHEIAHRVGYQDVRSFSRIFRYHKGINPSQYRASTRNHDKI